MSRTTTPKKVRQALHPPAEMALGLPLQAVTARHWIALETIGSPIVGAAMPRRPTTLADYAAAIALLHLPPNVAADLATRPADLQKTVDELLSKHTIPELQAAAHVVIRRIRQAMLLDDAPAAPARKPGGGPAESPPDPT